MITLPLNKPKMYPLKAEQKGGIKAEMHPLDQSTYLTSYSQSRSPVYLSHSVTGMDYSSAVSDTQNP